MYVTDSFFRYTETHSFNPFVTNGLSHSYHLDKSAFIFRGMGSGFSFLFHFSMKFIKPNRIVPDGTPRFAALHLWLFCLPLSHKKDARLIWVNFARFRNFCLWLYKNYIGISANLGCYFNGHVPFCIPKYINRLGFEILGCTFVPQKITLLKLYTMSVGVRKDGFQNCACLLIWPKHINHTQCAFKTPIINTLINEEIKYGMPLNYKIIKLYCREAIIFHPSSV